jgi:hypothetical protein
MIVRVLRREDLRFLLLEGVMVLMGVLAALLVEGAREEAANRRAVRVATERLVLEVDQNAEELKDLQEVVTERLALLRELRSAISTERSLAELVPQFGGFRTPDFNNAAWDRLSRSSLGESADPDLLRDAFYLYEWNEQFEALDGEINDLVFSERQLLSGYEGFLLDHPSRGG